MTGSCGHPRAENGAADDFTDLGDYSVSKSGKALQPIGNPISHSTHGGFSGPFSSAGVTISRSFALDLEPPHLHIARPPVPVTAVGVGISGFKKSRGGLPPERIASAFVLLASGVGSKPDSVPLMRGANVGSRKAIPLRIVPDLGQVSENAAKPCAWLLRGTSKQVCDVLHDDEAGSKFANETGVLRPKTAAGAVDPSLPTCEADVLAGEASADRVNGNSICGQALGGEAAHVFVAGDIGPVLLEDSAAEGFDLAEGDGLEAASALQPEAEAADSRKEVERAQHHPAPRIQRSASAGPASTAATITPGTAPSSRQAQTRTSRTELVTSIERESLSFARTRIGTSRLCAVIVPFVSAVGRRDKVAASLFIERTRYA